MSKKKQFNNRLNDLFADMGEDELPVSEDGDILPGWTWQCDAVGYYTACGPEVEDILGHRASSFLGQLMTQYQLSPESATDLMAAIGEGENTSIEITLHFKSKRGKLIPIRSKIFRQDTNTGEISGWSGFAQLIQPISETPPQYLPEKSPPFPTSDDSSRSTIGSRTPSQNFGLAVEENQTLSVSSPYSGAGKQSLKQQQTISYPSAPGIEAALAVPFEMSDQSVGLLEVIDTSPEREWKVDEQHLVEEVAEQLSLAMENARLFEETQISLNRTEALFEVSRASIAFEDTKELLQSVVNTITAVLPTNRTLAVVCDIQKEEIFYFLESNALPIPIEENTFSELMDGLTGWCLRERKPAISLKGSIDLRESEKARNIRERSMDGSIIVVPMVYRDQVFGTLTAINSFDQPDFTQNDVDLLSAMSNQVATALANANSFQEEQRRGEELAVLNEMGQKMTTLLDVDATLETIDEYTSRLVDTTNLYIALYDQEQDLIDFRIQYHKGVRRTGEVRKAGNGLTEYIFRTRKTLFMAHDLEERIAELGIEAIGSAAAAWLGTPLLIGDRPIGVIAIQDYRNPYAYDEHTIEVMESIAAQAAVAIHNARLYQQAQSRSTQLQTAAEVSRAASSILDPNPLIEQTVNLIRERFDLYYVGVFLTGETVASTKDPGEWAVLRAGTGDAGRIQIERNHKLEVGGTSMIGQCIETAQPQISQQVQAEEQRFVNPLLPETRSELALPLISRGLVTGAMTIQSTQPTAFAEEDIAILQTMADQVANALQNASLFDQTQIRAEELAVLNEMSRQLTATVNIEDIARNIYLFTSRLIDTSTFFIALYDEKTNSLDFPFATEENQEITIGDHAQSQGLTKHVIDTREPLLITENVETWMQTQNMDFVAFGDGKSQIAQSWLGVPMLAGDKVIGIINVQHKDPHHYGEQEQDLLVAIASQGTIAFQNAGLFAETRQRTEDLAVLNEMSAILSNTLDVDAIANTVYEHTSKLMDTYNLFIAQYNRDRDTINFLVTNHFGERIEIGELDLGAGLSAFMINNLRPLFLNGDIPKQMNDLGIEQLTITDENPPVSFVGAPMVIGGQPIGVIGLQSYDTPYLYQERHRDLIISIASHTAIAIQNANLFEEARKRSEELQLINRVVSRVAASLDLTESLQIIADEIGKTTRADSTGVALLNEERTALTIMADYLTQPGITSAVGLELPLEKNPASQEIIETRKSMVILDPQNSPLTKSIHEPMRQRGIETIMLLPLIVSGQVIGTVGIDIAEKNRTFTEGEINLVDTIVLQAATAIENARLFEQTQQQLEDLTIIQETTTKLSETLNIEDVVNTILAQTIQSVQADSGSLYLLQDDHLTRLGIHPQPEDGETTTGEEIQLEKLPITKMVVETRKPSISRTDDPSLQEHARMAFKEAGIAVNANIPMIGPEGVIGILTLNRFEPAQLFDSEEINLVSTLANQAAAALENARLYQELRETAEQLREVDTLKSQFLANMSHELRTPLNSIIGFSRVIMKGIDGPVTDLQQQDLSAIYNAGQHLLHMINDILDISKIEAGKMELAFDDVELPSVIESVLSTARGLVKDKPVKLVTAVDDDLPIIIADPTRIRQILLNLISNSAKFTSDGSITVVARKQENQKGGQEIYLAVTDTGSGIAEEDQLKLFIPFSQVDGSPTRKVEGTGLGLSITRLLVDLHGGEIGVISELGEGCTFWFTLPLPESSVQPDKDGNFIVLAIDDDVQVISLYERYLTSAGYQVIGITDPHEALEKVRQIKPYAITLDIMMPDFDGWKLLEDLKADPEIGQIPVVICSILAEYDKGMKLGAANYLTKPILEDDIVHSLNKLREEP